MPSVTKKSYTSSKTGDSGRGAYPYKIKIRGEEYYVVTWLKSSQRESAINLVKKQLASYEENSPGQIERLVKRTQDVKGFLCKTLLLVNPEKNNQAVATAVWHEMPDRGFAELHFFVVDTKYQKKGIGSTFINWWAENHLARRRICYAFCYADDNAIGFYNKNNYFDVPEAGKPGSEFFDRKRIAAHMTRCIHAKLMGVRLLECSKQRQSFEKTIKPSLERIEEKFAELGMNKLPVQFTYIRRDSNGDETKEHQTNRLLLGTDVERGSFKLHPKKGGPSGWIFAGVVENLRVDEKRRDSMLREIREKEEEKKRRSEERQKRAASGRITTHLARNRSQSLVPTGSPPFVPKENTVIDIRSVSREGYAPRRNSAPDLIDPKIQTDQQAQRRRIAANRVELTMSPSTSTSDSHASDAHQALLKDVEAAQISSSGGDMCSSALGNMPSASSSDYESSGSGSGEGFSNAGASNSLSHNGGVNLKAPRLAAPPRADTAGGGQKRKLIQSVSGGGSPERKTGRVMVSTQVGSSRGITPTRHENALLGKNGFQIPSAEDAGRRIHEMLDSWVRRLPMEERHRFEEDAYAAAEQAMYECRDRDGRPPEEFPDTRSSPEPQSQNQYPMSQNSFSQSQNSQHMMNSLPVHQG